MQDGSPGAVGPFVPASAFTISTSDTTPGAQSAFYWSATTNEPIPSYAWGVSFVSGSVGVNVKASSGRVWCVRGGMNADTY